jgi:hypothetical protein
MQLEATRVLAELMQSQDPQQTAMQYVDSLNPQFFQVVEAYLALVRHSATCHRLCMLDGGLLVDQAWACITSFAHSYMQTSWDCPCIHADKLGLIGMEHRNDAACSPIRH